MSGILNIDMDFYLDKIAYWIDDNKRLDDTEYTPWSEKEFRLFLENRCLLSLENPIKGRIITNHHEAFFFWDELINKRYINTPFSVTHVDAHSDTGIGDSGYVYLMGELMNYPIDKRRTELNTGKVLLGNYLSYALACGWIKDIDFILHELWDNDIFSLYLKNFDINERNFELKGYNKSIDIGLMINKIIDGGIKPSIIDSEIPFNLIPWQSFEAKDNFDYLIFCQSPGYTTVNADYMLDVIKDYIIEI